MVTLRIVRAECMACRRTADFFANDLAGFYGYGREIERFPFKCSGCNQAADKIYPVFYEHDERSEHVVWRPVKINHPFHPEQPAPIVSFLSLSRCARC